MKMQARETTINPGFGSRIAAALVGVIEVWGIIGTTATELGARIAGRVWTPAAAIPKEVGLCDEGGASRPVIREAFRIIGTMRPTLGRTSDATRVLLLDPELNDGRIRKGWCHPILAAVSAQSPAAAGTRRRPRRNDSNQRQGPRFISANLKFHLAFLTAVESKLPSQLLSAIEAAASPLLDKQKTA